MSLCARGCVRSPGLLRDLPDGLAAAADDGADHFRLDEDPEREVDRTLSENIQIS